MMKNDYRRSLILLRCNEPGYSGHVRLERRTLMGSMYFLVQPVKEGETLHALLVGRSRDSYTACLLGRLSRDQRGQAVLSHSFDPRNICGMELEDYQLIAVAAAAGSECRIVLYGNVNGHADLNWERVRQAVCLSLNPSPGRPSAPQPRDEAAQMRRGQEEEPLSGETEHQAETITSAAERETMQPAEAEKMPEELSAEAGAAQPAAVPETVEADVQGAVQTAAQLLGVETALPWPEEIEELRMRFAQSPPMENAPDNGYVYISAPLPQGSPYDYLAVGLKTERGLPSAVSYALPAVYTPEPPAGLESYEWLGDNNRGWWISEVDLNDGRNL